MKRSIFLALVLTLLSAVMFNSSNSLDSSKGEVIFDAPWSLVYQEHDENDIAYWLIPVRIDNDTVMARYYDAHTGKKDVVATKLLYDKGYPINHRYTVAYLRKKRYQEIYLTINVVDIK